MAISNYVILLLDLAVTLGRHTAALPCPLQTKHYRHQGVAPPPRLAGLPMTLVECSPPTPTCPPDRLPSCCCRGYRVLTEK